MLREMLANLIDNAIRYTPQGGRVTVRFSRPPLASASPGGFELVGPPAQVVIEVEDDGLGIPAAERARVVERFYRILGREAEGSGLGLAIVAEIVAMHRGSLEIADHYGEAHPGDPGVRVRVFLPASSARTYP